MRSGDIFDANFRVETPRKGRQNDEFRTGYAGA